MGSNTASRCFDSLASPLFAGWVGCRVVGCRLCISPVASGGDDTIRGNAGADTLYPGAGQNALLGNSQIDIVIQDMSYE